MSTSMPNPPYVPSGNRRFSPQDLHGPRILSPRPGNMVENLRIPGYLIKPIWNSVTCNRERADGDVKAVHQSSGAVERHFTGVALF